jgi:hypothetical protein
MIMALLPVAAIPRISFYASSLRKLNRGVVGRSYFPYLVIMRLSETFFHRDIRYLNACEAP